MDTAVAAGNDGSDFPQADSSAMAGAAAWPKHSEARERLLQTASDLFYREGIHSVGIDRIIAEARVTRATLYRHFPGKEQLVAAYLLGEDTALRDSIAAAVASIPPDKILDAILEGIADDIGRHHTRGCPFINAAAEFPDPTSEVRRIVDEHRRWFRSSLEQALESAGHSSPKAGAASLVLLRDAALVGGYLDGVEATRAAFIRTAKTVLAAD